MESIERLLAEIQSEYNENENKSSERQIQPTLKPEKPAQPNSDAFSDLSENTLIAELRAEYVEQSKQPASETSVAENRLIAEIKVEYEQNPQQQTFFSSSERTSSLLDNFSPLPELNLIADLKAEFEELQRAEELQRQQQLKEEQLKRLEAIATKAREWLKNLDPLSEEGLWFEELAYKYPSKLEAAIDYLQTLEKTPS